MTTITPALQARLAAVERRLTLIEDRDAIERLQNQYGFYLDNRMFKEVGDFFFDAQPSIEIGPDRP